MGFSLGRFGADFFFFFLLQFSSATVDTFNLGGCSGTHLKFQAFQMFF